MLHFAKIEKGVVVQVIVADKPFINKMAGKWVETCPNTYGGINAEGNEPLRKNYAGVGYTYDSVLDAFIPPKPYNSWVLDQESCLWEPPVPQPSEMLSGELRFVWDEESVSWKQVP